MGRLFSFIILAILATACGGGGAKGGGGSPNVSANYTHVLTVLPATASISGNGTQLLSVYGGLQPYHFQIMSGGGSVDYNTGIFSAPATSTTTTILISDSTGLMTQATINVSGSAAPPPPPAPQTTNCSAMQVNVAFQDSSASGVDQVMNVQSLADSTTCANRCGLQQAGYCEWSPNNGNPVCVAWPASASISQYTSSWPVYSAVCQ